MQPSDAETRELTVDEAVTLAILLQQREQLAEAQALLERVLGVAPDHPQALHFAGVLAHQQQRSADALRLIERSLAHEPHQADWHNNHGIVLQASARLDEAAAAYRQALAIDPNHANAHSNLGVVLRAVGDPIGAERCYRAAIAIDPQHIDAYHNLGVLLNSLRRTQEAAACYCKVITLRPQHREARRLLALAHCALGETDEAVKIFDNWLAEDPDDPVARHMHAACSGQHTPARASNAFVAATFDSFAASFESKLERLAYRAPALVAAMVDHAGLSPAKQLDVLDGGCGTGLCGPLLAPYARRLVGVDLSRGMLAHARAKEAYDFLVNAELTDYLRGRADGFDLIVSADTLVYFGDLVDVFAAAAAALRQGGQFVFTLEHLIESNESAVAASPGYRLETHGRYAHGRRYVEETLAGVGLIAEIVEAELRMEAGVPVAGLVIRAARTPRPPAPHPSQSSIAARA